MAWFAELAGKAESLLNNLDEQTGAALRNHNMKNSKLDKLDYPTHPDGSWNQRKRNIVKSLKRPVTAIETKSASIPSRKSSPIHQSRAPIKVSPDKTVPRLRKSPSRKPTPFHLEHCPKTLVDEVQGDREMIEHFGYNRKRYNSLPLDLDSATSDGDFNIRMQNLEVENAMLKNELNVLNREVSELLDKTRSLEDGNDVDRCSKELNKAHNQIENSALQTQRVVLEKDTLAGQMDLLKQRINEINNLKQNYQEEKQGLVADNNRLRETNNILEDRITELSKKIEDTSTCHLKLEGELRHAQTTISELQGDLDKSKEECQRLEKDWETYKLRVKSMLHAKDNEIKSLQDGLNFSEDTKVLVEQLDSLKEERDELSEAITAVRDECESMKRYIAQVENRRSASERVVSALRDTVKDERAARNKAEAQLMTLTKELKHLQTETSQTIANLRTALRDKEAELHNLRETSSIKTTDSSALNVADYDKDATIENEKIQYLTETLVQRQGRIDKLLAENNMLKIQMDKLELKYKAEHSRNSTHSIVNVESRSRRIHSDSLFNAVSYRLGAVMRSHPVIRLGVIAYMICLHFWVVTVLLSNTPTDNYPPRHPKS